MSRLCQKAAAARKLHESGNCLVLAATLLTFAGKHIFAMTKKQRQELIRLEKSIKKPVRYVAGHGCGKPLSSLDASQKEALEEALSVRQNLLNDMFLCTQEEVMDFRRTNERLYALTQKMHEKSVSLYRAIKMIDIILQEGGRDDYGERDDFMPVPESFRHYVNMRNRSRIPRPEDGGISFWSEAQCLRFDKAWMLLWKILSERLMTWGD